MSNFTPDPGTLFYASTTIVHVREIMNDNTAVAVRAKDRTNNSLVFRCVALDDHAVIADAVWGLGFAEKSRRMLLRSEYTFQPLGPGVAQALDLEA